MLSRSFVAVICGALAVAGVPGKNPYYDGYSQGYGSGEQWVAHADGPQPGRPDGPPMHPPGPPGPPPPPSGPPDHPPPPPGAPDHPLPPHGPGHHHPPKVDDKTIYQALSEDARFSRVFKLVNYTEEITSLLNDPSASVTFFAPPDKALRPPKPHKPHHAPKDTEFDQFGVEAFFASDVIETPDELDMFATAEGFVDTYMANNVDDDEDKERKEKIIKKIVTAVLSYHIIPAELPAADLAKNTTFPTSLKLGDGSLDTQPLRLRVEQPPRLRPTLVLNFYATVLYADVKTKNGLIHVINHPLFPPPSIFETLFAFTDVFSTFTSAIQRTKLTEEIDWHFVWDSKTVEGSPALTLFAPTNGAFRRLPKDLKLFLFSPFGAKALKKVLSLHVVPEYVLHTNWVHNASDSLTGRSVSDYDDAYGRIPSFIGDDFEFSRNEDGGFDHMEFASGARPDASWGPFPTPLPSRGPWGPPPFGGSRCMSPLPPQLFEGRGPFPPPPPPFEEMPHHPPHPPPPFVKHAPPPFEQRPPPPPFEGHSPPPFGRPPPHFEGHPPPPFEGHPPPPVEGHPPPPFEGHPPPPFEGHPPPPFEGHPPPPRFEGHPPPPPFDRHSPFPPPPFEGSPPRPHPPFGHMPPPPPFAFGQPPPHRFGPPGPPPPFGSHCGPNFAPRFGGPPHFPTEGHPPHSPCDHDERPRRPLPHPKPIYSVNATLPTLLANQSLRVHVAQFKTPFKRYQTALFVNGAWVVARDVPARNGAIHVVDRLIRPQGVGKPREDDEFAPKSMREEIEGEWADWEEWLPQWAEEN